MYLTRRGFVKVAIGGMSALIVPSWSRVARAQASSDRTVVVIFLRGGADGLNLVAPIDPAGVSQVQRDRYVALRDGIGLSVSAKSEFLPASLPLDGYFMLHGNMSRLTDTTPGQEGLWAQDRLAIVHAVGGTNNYSHFVAQDSMERAVASQPHLVDDGWLFRTAGSLTVKPDPEALTGISLGAATAKSLVGSGADRSVSMPSVGAFNLANFPPNVAYGTERQATISDLFTRAAHPLLRAAGGSAFAALGTIQGMNVAGIQPAVTYQQSQISPRLQDAARLVKSGIGVRLITIDHGGWDHHQALPEAIWRRAGELSNGLTDFYRDLDADGKGDDVLTICMTEFGRTAAENQTGAPAEDRGTDHGWGTVMFVAGGNVAGGRVQTRAYLGNTTTGEPTPTGHWPGLLSSELHDSNGPRDLQSSTDFRDVFAEVLQSFLGFDGPATQGILRGYSPTPVGLFV